MSSEKTVSDNFAVFVLFYCWQQGDMTKYALNLKRLGHIVRSDDEYGSKEIIDWKMAYMPPTQAVLQTFVLETVLHWYRMTYELPVYVLTAQGIPQLNDSDMHNMFMGDFVCCDVPLVFNTTHHMLYFYDKTHNKWKHARIVA
jgi:hypothetical protein